MDFQAAFMEAAIHLVKARGMGVIDPVPDLGITKPPPKLTETLEKLGQLGTIKFPDKAERMYDRAVNLIQVGEFQEAQSVLKTAMRSTRDQRLKTAIESRYQKAVH